MALPTSPSTVTDITHPPPTRPHRSTPTTRNNKSGPYSPLVRLLARRRRLRAQQTSESRPLLLVPRRLRGQHHAIINQRMDHGRPPVLDHQVHEAIIAIRNLREREPLAVRALDVEAHAHAVRTVLLILVGRVLDEVAPALTMAAVVPPVTLERRPVHSLNGGIGSDDLEGFVKHRIGREFRGHQLPKDVVAADRS